MENKQAVQMDVYFFRGTHFAFDINTQFPSGEFCGRWYGEVNDEVFHWGHSSCRVITIPTIEMSIYDIGGELLAVYAHLDQLENGLLLERRASGYFHNGYFVSHCGVAKVM